jgi:hypothetical protein
MTITPVAKATRFGMKKAVILPVVVAGVVAVTALATSAIGHDRLALWRVVQACVADFKLTGAPFPCLEVDLSGGEDRGVVVLRPPLSNDLIIAPTPVSSTRARGGRFDSDHRATVARCSLGRRWIELFELCDANARAGSSSRNRGAGYPG